MLDIEISHAAKLIKENFYIEIGSIKFLGKGYDNVVYLVNEKFAFRFPRHKNAVDCLLREINITNYIKSKVSFSLSAPIFIGSPDSDYPFLFAGYNFIPGEPLAAFDNVTINSSEVAKIIAEWLKELHSLKPIANHKNFFKIKSEINWIYNVKKRINDCILLFKKYSNIYKKFNVNEELCINLLKNFSSFHKEQDLVYVHGDLDAEHIIFDNKFTPKGIIDWGDVNISEREIDLALVWMSFCRKSIKSFFDTYGTLTHNSIMKSKFFALYHIICSLPYCLESKAKNIWPVTALNNFFQLNY